MPPILSPAAGTTLLPRRISEMIFEDVARTSIVQQLARRVDLPGSGVAIPMTTGKPTAGWVAEGDRKPVSDSTLGTKIMDPKKLATIVVFSQEFLRRDITGLFSSIRNDIREAFADAFDAAAIHGTSSPFTNHIAETTKTVAFGTAATTAGGYYGDIVAGLSLLADDRKRLTGFAADPLFEPLALTSFDANGRPILTEVGGDGLTQRLIGRPVGFGEGVSGVTGDENVRLVGGDWRKVAYGVGRDISFDISTEGSVELTPGGEVVHLFQDNMAALRAEAEYGLVIGDVNAFVTYTEGA
jgi:HK97 family phage major capsid protein